MELKILPTKQIINTYKRYSLPVTENEPTDIQQLPFFYIGTQTRNIEKLKEHFEFGYISAAAGNAIITLKRMLKKQEGVIIPNMIIAEGTLGTEQLIELHKFIYSHRIMADVPFIVEANGLSPHELSLFKRYAFIDELLFLNEFTAPALLRKAGFLKKMKQKRVQQPESCTVETAFATYPDVRSVLKRGLDLLISSTLLAALSPVMLLIALAVKLDTGGPVLYTTIRTGRGFRIFHLYKFNTVIQDKDKMKNGASISRVGMFLRKTSLDELPLLLNVWLGDLSLRGHRALPLYEASRLTTNTCANHFLSAVGITGWQNSKNDLEAIPADAQLVPGAGNGDKSDLLYDIWLMANKSSGVISKTNA
jgi:lipopolysaccharide/colanic/teichoic acid biosynthesis glycosyltransferase